MSKYILDSECINLDFLPIITPGPRGPQGAMGPQGDMGGSLAEDVINLSESQPPYLINTNYPMTTIINNENPFSSWMARMDGSGSTFVVNNSIGTDGIFVPIQSNDGIVEVYNSLNGVNLGLTGPGDASGSIHLVKYDFDGNVEWMTRMKTSTLNQTESSPKCASSDNGIYVACPSIEDVNQVYDASNGSIPGITGQGATAGTIVLVKYDLNGKSEWMARYGNGYNLFGLSNYVFLIEMDYGNNSVYLCGEYRSPIGPFLIYDASDASVVGITSPATGIAGDGYVIKYNGNGKSQWMSRITGTGNVSDTVWDVKATEDSVYAIATSSSNIQVYNGPNGTQLGVTGPQNSSTASYLIKYDISGQSQWITRMTRLSDSGSINARKLSIYEDGIYIVGYASSNIIGIYDSPNGTILGLTGQGLPGIYTFVIKYNLEGKGQWMATISNSIIFTSFINVNETGVYVYGTSNNAVLNVYNGPNAEKLGIIGIGDVNGYSYLVKFDFDGKSQWMTKITPTIAGGISLLGNDIYMTMYNGTSNQTSLYYPNNGTILGLTGPNEITGSFLVKLSQDISCKDINLNVTTSPPFQKFINYQSEYNNCINIIPQQNMIYPGVVGNVSELKTDQNGSTLNLLYSSTNKWSILGQNGFDIS